MKVPPFVSDHPRLEPAEKDALTDRSKAHSSQHARDYVSITSDHNSPTSGGTSESTGLSGDNFDHTRQLASSGNKEMAKCLTTLDVVSLGVGSSLGTGMYLTTGIVAAGLAGPAGCFSFALAALASLLSGAHFAKLSSLFPNTSGSAYMYTLATVGEFSAFIIGWGLVVEYMIGTSAAAIALSETIDSLCEGRISALIEQNLPSLPKLDPMAGGVCLILTAVLASGVEISSKVNNLLNLLNFAVLFTFLSASIALGDFSNLTRGGGVRGFFPYGYAGVLEAVPVAYFAFIGFDGLAATGAECKTPARSIPAGILLSIVINALAYIAVVLALTINVDYRNIPEATAMLDVFPIMGYPALKYVLAVGAVAGLLAAAFGSLFPLPRVVQAMAQDGFVFRYFSYIHPTRHTAMRATIILGTVSTLVATTVDLNFLIELVLIGTLLGYVIVTFAVVFILYVEIDTPREVVASAICVQQKYSKMDGNAGNNGSDDTPPLSQENQGTKIRVSDSEESGEELIRKDKVSISSPSLERPRSRSALDSQKSLETPINVSKHRRHSDHNQSAVEDNFHNSTSQHQTILLNEDRQQPSNCFQNCQKSCFNFLKHIVVCLATAARYVCDGRNSSDVMKLLMFSSRKQITVLMVSIYTSLFVCCVALTHLLHLLAQGEPLTTVLFVLSSGVAVISTLLLIVQPQLKRRGIQAALSPLVSIFTAFINLYLMASLRLMAWCLFAAWMLLGLLIYYLYARKPAWMTCCGWSSIHQEKVGLLDATENKNGLSYQ